eukprot:TRINITY_DN2214_c0_g1_i1.p1 TRINITY_DN2214_c0_g1~~TRINITY_DN2214_c0_g1_i1.p1  ORF type:complete len:308 (+),score=76.90 TRINITY_DN2214_c0_g1_i1:91-1014(+)
MPSVDSKKTVSIVGCGYPGGQPKPKVEDGPDAIRNQGVVEAVQKLGYNVVDRGNLNFKSVIEETKNAKNHPNVKNSVLVGRCTEQLFKTNFEALSNEDTIALTLGGDHSLAMGSIAATSSRYDDLGLIWVDAHADINTPAVSPSGNVHGMPLAFLMGLVEDKVAGLEWVPAKITPDRLVYIALRDVDEGEREIIKDKNILAFHMDDIAKLGIEEVMKRTLEHLKGRPLHVSYDVDGNDPTVSPSTGTRVDGGLSRDEAKILCERVAETRRLVGLDIVEVNPGIGDENDATTTAKNAVELITTLLGSR